MNNPSNIVTVNAELGEMGERVYLWSPLQTFEADQQLVIRYRIKKGNKLFVFLYSDVDSLIGQYKMDLQCDGVWHETRVCVPSGTYRIVFAAQVPQRLDASDISIDDVTFLDRSPNNCSKEGFLTHRLGTNAYFSSTIAGTVVLELITSPFNNIYFLIS